MIVIFKKYKSIIYVFASNIISLCIGAFLSFFIPYILDVEGFGYYKQFTLYLSYIGLLHFGFNDGIYLEYGSYNYGDLDKAKFSLYFRYLFTQQLLTSFVLFILFFLIFKDNSKLFIFGFVLLNTIFLNISKYYSFICQFTKNYLVYSILYLVEKAALFIPVLFLFLFNLRYYKFVVISQTLINIFLFISFIIYYKDITFNKCDIIKSNKKEITRIIHLGVSLMLGNFIIIMIFNIDRIIINLFLPIEDFAIYSFAVSLLSIVLVFVSSFSMIIYPYLKRVDEKDYKKLYQLMGNIFTVISCISLSLFFPIKYIILEYLPSYIKAINVFLILLPGVALRAEIEIVINNLFKSLKKQFVYFRISVIILLVSIFLNIFLFYFFKNLYSIAIATLFSFIIWYIISDYYLIKYFMYKNIKKYIYITSSFLLYFILNFLNNIYISTILYLLISIILIFLIYRKTININIIMYNLRGNNK